MSIPETEASQSGEKNLKVEKESFLASVNGIYQDLKTKLSSDDLQQPLVISKNDSIEKRVDTIIKSMNEEKPILIVSYPGAVSKTVAITEIAKQKKSSKGNFKQFNHLSSQSSLGDTRKKSVAYMANYNKDLAVNLGIRDPKVHTMPIISVFITANENTASLEGWALQTI